MLFSSKPSHVVFVGYDGIILYPANGSKPLTLPEAVFQYLEIRDQAKLRELVAGFVAQGNVRKKKLIVLLSKEVVFQKAIALTKTSDIAAIKADFEDKIPLAPGDCQVVSLSQKDRLFLFGTNKTFYQLIVKELEAAGAKVVAVVPAAL